MAADLAVVGAGAAGLMTAIAAARTRLSGGQASPRRIILFDTRQKIGAKILISGGTRCNVTNRQVYPSDYEGGPGHFVKHVLEAFTPEETIHFFEAIGVPLVLEPTGKYFPTTHSGKTVLEALLKEVKRLDIDLKTGVRITGIEKDESRPYPFHLIGENNFETMARRVVLTTGGLSYPETGSDGTGYGIATSFGHSVTSTSPALTPLLTNDPDWTALTGIALEAKLSFFRRGRKEKETAGSFLFTHFGFSGPAVLDVSRHFASSKKEEGPRLEANFIPFYNGETLKKSLEEAASSHPQKAIKSFITEIFLLPARFVDTLLKKAGLDAGLTLRRLRERDRGRLIHSLLHTPLEVTGVYGYKKAEVTAGGVDLREIKVQTMESKIVPGLYFAGEILDVDGRIGGFNFQWAWSSGALAGSSAAS